MVAGNGSCLLRWWLLPTSSYNEGFHFAFQFIQVTTKYKALATNDSKHMVGYIFSFFSRSKSIQTSIYDFHFINSKYFSIFAKIIFKRWLLISHESASNHHFYFLSGNFFTNQLQTIVFIFWQVIFPSNHFCFFQWRIVSKSQSFFWGERFSNNGFGFSTNSCQTIISGFRVIISGFPRAAFKLLFRVFE